MTTEAVSEFYQDHMDLVALARITADFITPHARTVGLSDGLYDSTRIQDGKLLLPTWSGPTRRTSPVLHEISHIVEIDDKRCHIPGYGFRYGSLKQIIMGKEYLEAVTWQATQREARVFAIQKHLVEHYDPMDLGLDGETYEDDVCDTLVRFMHDSHAIPARKGRGDYNTRRYPAVKKAMAAEYKKHSFESIRAEWNRKLKIMRRRQTKGYWKRYETMRYK